MAHPYYSFTYIFAPGSAPEILNFLKDHTPLGKKKKNLLSNPSDGLEMGC